MNLGVLLESKGW